MTMARKPLRIEIPTNVTELLNLAKEIYDKHLADGSKSVLKVMQDFDWDVEGPKVALALAKDKEAKDLEKHLEKIYEERNNLMANTPTGVKYTRDFLKGVYGKTPKTLGDYGYTVNDSPKAKKPSIPKA